MQQMSQGRPVPDFILLFKLIAQYRAKASGLHLKFNTFR